MPPLMLFRKLHKWVGLALGLQLVLWTLSGAAMAIIDHHAVAGEHIGHAPVPLTLAEAPLPLAAVQRAAPDGVVAVTLKPVAGRWIYEVRTASGTSLIDARTGAPAPVDARVARAVALEQYAGKGSVESVRRLARPNMETRDREGPLWRVQFNDPGDTAFYVSETSGQLLDKRTNAYRVWDVFWMIHIMDYTERQSFNHPLIWTLAAAGVWMSITGFVLIFLAFRRSDFAGLVSWIGPRARR